MSSPADVARGLALVTKSGSHLFKEEEQEQEAGALGKVLDLLNRGTEGTASAFDELLFEPVADPFKAWMDGIRGEGRVNNFGELSARAGWKPNSKVEKAAKFAITLGLDIGLDPLTYFSFGAAPVAKHLPKAASLLKSGRGLSKAFDAKALGQGFGKRSGIGKAAQIIERAEKLKDPKVDEVLAKLMKGEDITKAEEAVLGARTIMGIQAPFGTSMMRLTPKDSSVKFFTQMSTVNSWLQKAPVISPVIHGVGKAFNSYYELRRKVPLFMKMRQSRDQKINYASAQGFQRAVQSIVKVATEKERKLITQLMEMPDAGVLTQSFYKDVTPFIEDNPALWEDLGLAHKAELSEEESVKLVDHWLNMQNKWISEFGDEGIMSRTALGAHADELSTAIREENDKIAQLEGILKGLDDEGSQFLDAKDVPAFKKQLKDQIETAGKNMEEFVILHDAAKDRMLTQLGPESRPLSDFNLGAGSFGQVKGRWDILKFQNHVIKLPVALDAESFGSMVVEAKVYKTLEGIPGIGTARLVFREMPISDAIAHQEAIFPGTFAKVGGGLEDVLPHGGKIEGAPKSLTSEGPTPPVPDSPREIFGSGMGDDVLDDLADSGFIITKTDGTKVLKVPYLTKRLIDIDDEATAAFHATGGNPHWNMPTTAIRDFEKMLKRSSQSGVHLSDLHSGNLIIDKKGKVHLIDLGYGNEINKTPEGLQSAWRRNLLRFADHVINRTKHTNKAVQAELAPLVDKYIRNTRGSDIGNLGITGVTRAETVLIQDLLKKVGMPLRHLTEAGSTKALPEGFTAAAKAAGGQQRFKMKQRSLVEERNIVIDQLSPAAMEAYEDVMLWKRELTDRLLANGLLTEDWITGFEAKFGIPHLRHLKSEEGLVRRFQHAVSLALTKKAGTLKARRMEGTIKEIHDRMGKEFFETDISRIMFASEVEVTTAIENWKLLNKVAENTDWTKDALAVVRKVPIKRGKKKGQFRDVDTFQAEEGFELINHPLFEGSQVREEIADDINRMIGKTREDMGHQLIKKWYDPAHKWLRAYTLFLFPSYHIRNFAGAVWNNFLADVDPMDHFRSHKVIFGGKKVERWADEFGKGMPFQVDGMTAPNPNRKLSFKIDGKNFTHQELLDEANEFGVMGRGQYGPHGDIERGMAGELGSILPKKGIQGAIAQTGVDNTFVQFGARVGTQVENVVRLAHYMSKRKDGLSAMDAALSVKKYHFDYQELSDFERNWLKRTFFFYTWTRKNVPLQAKMFLTRPGKFLAGLKAKEEVETQFGGPEPDKRLVPEWLRDQLGMRFKYDKETDTYEYFLLGSWWPAADLARIFDPGDELINMASPLLKVPIERAMNKSSFFDTPIEKIPGERKEFISPEAGKVLGGIPGTDAISKLLFDAPIEEGVTIPGKLHHLLRQFRPANEARRWAEAVARGGPELGLVNSLIGKSYEFNPDRARKGKDYEIKFQIGVLKGQLKKAQRRGKPSEVRKLLLEIQRLREGLIR